MRRRNFVASLSSLALISCNPRLDERKKRYDEKECPFCSIEPGKCSYCDGTGKCSFCKGTGKRVTSTENYPLRGVEQLKHEDDCPYCKGSGSCKYCDGVGKCWACKGTGRIESWDFYEQYKEEKKKKEQQKKPDTESEKKDIDTSSKDT